MGYLKGFAAEETKAVLAQTLGLAAQSGNVAERLKARYARWIALRRLFADAGVSADRRGEGAVRGARAFVRRVRFGVLSDRYPPN
jgi:hypothetical protein